MMISLVQGGCWRPLPIWIKTPSNWPCKAGPTMVMKLPRRDLSSMDERIYVANDRSGFGPDTFGPWRPSYDPDPQDLSFHVSASYS